MLQTGGEASHFHPRASDSCAIPVHLHTPSDATSQPVPRGGGRSLLPPTRLPAEILALLADQDCIYQDGEQGQEGFEQAERPTA